MSLLSFVSGFFRLVNVSALLFILYKNKMLKIFSIFFLLSGFFFSYSAFSSTLICSVSNPYVTYSYYSGTGAPYRNCSPAYYYQSNGSGASTTCLTELSSLTSCSKYNDAGSFVSTCSVGKSPDSNRVCQASVTFKFPQNQGIPTSCKDNTVVYPPAVCSTTDFWYRWALASQTLNTICPDGFVIPPGGVTTCLDHYFSKYAGSLAWFAGMGGAIKVIGSGLKLNNGALVGDLFLAVRDSAGKVVNREQLFQLSNSERAAIVTAHLLGNPASPLGVALKTASGLDGYPIGIIPSASGKDIIGSFQKQVGKLNCLSQA